jgi:hypothetical protein
MNEKEDVEGPASALHVARTRAESVTANLIAIPNRHVEANIITWLKVRTKAMNPCLRVTPGPRADITYEGSLKLVVNQLDRPTF